MKTIIPVFAAAILASAFAGCVITTKGVFDGAEAAGWTHTIEDGGVSVYRLGPRRSAQAHVSFATESADSVYVNAEEYPSSRANDGIQIVFNDSRTSRILKLQPQMTLDVKGSKDFTITFPSFTIGGVSNPGLNVRFRWSDRTVRYYQQLQ